MSSFVFWRPSSYENLWCDFLLNTLGSVCLQRLQKGKHMRQLIVLGLVGLVAQLIDGSLGMAYGVTSTTLLLAAGTAPAAASAAVHFSDPGATVVAGISHHKFGNVGWRTVGLLAGPGFIGALIGSTVLANLNGEAATPWVSGILRALGVYVIWRFL